MDHIGAEDRVASAGSFSLPPAGFGSIDTKGPRETPLALCMRNPGRLTGETELIQV